MRKKIYVKKTKAKKKLHNSKEKKNYTQFNEASLAIVV